MTRHSIDTALLEAAAEWRVRLSSDEVDPDPAVAGEFQDWLSADPAHAEAFDRTTAAWSLLEPHRTAPEVIRARRDALDFARRSSERRWSATPGRRGVMRIAAAVGVAAVLGAGLWPMVDGVEVYRTGLGERRMVTLDDGSTVSLDSGTRVAVRYRDDARRLTLEKGQARFDVAHNPLRPFSVKAHDRTVVATGTAFNVDILDGDVAVTLIEGSVIVAPVAGANAAQAGSPKPLAGPVALHSGQRLLASPGQAGVAVEAVSLEEATAWQRGKMVFNDVPLGEAVMRVNRYSDRKVIIRDGAIADLHVSGVFLTGDAGAFARAMAQYLGIEADFVSGEIVLRPGAAA